MPETSQNADEIRAERRAALAKLRGTSGGAYPPGGRGCAIRELKDKVKSASDLPFEVELSGRLALRRKMGKATFASLSDGSKRLSDTPDAAIDSIQLYASTEQDEWRAWLNELHLGDIVRVKGSLFFTKKNELTVQLAEGQVLAKCLEPYTSKEQLTETRQRKHRYFALAVQPEMRDRFRARSQLISAVRSFFDEEGFLEVETPVLHEVQGGALAKPFRTGHTALEREFCLRIAPELYLKRLLVGGFDKVYEIGRTFRNEGMSDRHNPEFTMMEFYAAYQRHTDFMPLIERLLHQLVEADWYGAYLSAAGQTPAGAKNIDLRATFAQLSFYDCLRERLGLSDEQLQDKSYLLTQAAGISGDKASAAGAGTELGQLHLLLFEKKIEHTLAGPVFITGFPACVSPLTRRSDSDPAVAERCDLYIDGKELATVYSELNDPDEQRRVFEQQVAHAAAGDDEAMRYDEDFIRALQYGMPPAAGAGVGIDRLIMLLLGLDSIRDAILFPQLRPEGA